MEDAAHTSRIEKRTDSSLTSSGIRRISSANFRVEVAEATGDGFVLFPGSGRAAVHAFHDPFAVEPHEGRAPHVMLKAAWQ